MYVSHSFDPGRARLRQVAVVCGLTGLRTEDVYICMYFYVCTPTYYMHTYIYPFTIVSLSIYLSIYLSVWLLSIDVPICLLMDRSVYPSICWSIDPLVYLSICLSIYPHIYLFIAMKRSSPSAFRLWNIPMWNQQTSLRA